MEPAHLHQHREPNGHGEGPGVSIAMHDSAAAQHVQAVAVPEPEPEPEDLSQHQTLVPPYWQRHLRNDSSLSAFSLDLHRAPIRLEDHTEEGSEQSKALWARSARIDDYVVISGAAPGIGDYVVYNCTVDTLNVSS
jgi:hypothetical protein